MAMENSVYNDFNISSYCLLEFDSLRPSQKNSVMSGRVLLV